MTVDPTAVRITLLVATLTLTACSEPEGNGPADRGTGDSGTTQRGNGAQAGFLRGQLNTEVTLLANGEPISVTVARSNNSTEAYDATSFRFPKPLISGEPYSLIIQKAPEDQTCAIYKGAMGTAPLLPSSILVGCERTFEFISRSTNDEVRASAYDSNSPSIGGANEPIGVTAKGYGEGRFSAFVSKVEGLVPGFTAEYWQVFYRDSLTGTTVLVSTALGGGEGNGESWAPALSADGLTVVFQSSATNLVANDTNGVRDVFLWSALDPTKVQRVSVGVAGAEADGESGEAAVSGDGRVVAFASSATNLVTSSRSSSGNVYRRDLVAGTTVLVSATIDGLPARAWMPAMSEDGQRIAFWSNSPNIVADDTNGIGDIFVYDHSTETRTRVSLTSTGAEISERDLRGGDFSIPAISGNGRFVAFVTTATNMVPGDTNEAQDVFVVDTQTLAVTRASVSSTGAQGNADSPERQGERPALSYTGDWVAFSTAANNLGTSSVISGSSNMVMHHRVTGETRALTNEVGSVGPASISRSAAYVAFSATRPLDLRTTSTGLFARFTAIENAWWWAN